MYDIKKFKNKFALGLVCILAFSFLTKVDAFGTEGNISGLESGINTLWVLLAAFLVFFMQAGFALLEAGFSRTKNTVSILMKNLLDANIGILSFFVVGFGLMFGSGNDFFGTTGFFLEGFDGVTDGLPDYALFFFQAVFAATAATIVSGAIAERAKFFVYAIYSVVLTALIYPIAGHWVWGGGWLSEFNGTGFLDFAGSTIVHSVGGWAALVAVIMIGARKGRFEKDSKVKGHNFVLAALGVFILWLGWYGFNPGSELAITGESAWNVSLITLNTTLAAITGSLGALIMSYLRTKKFDAGQTFNGVLAGLVAITAGCAFVSPLGAILIGSLGGAICVLGSEFLEKMKIDDAVGAVPVHLFNGIWGTLAVAFFHVELGLFYGGNFDLLISQIVGVLAFGIWTVVTSFILFKAIDMTIGLRVSEEVEEKGLDKKHAIEAYPEF